MNLGSIRLLESRRIIGGDFGQGPLLIRWIILRTPLFGVYLHKLLRSDHDRALHDHPWAFVSIVLKGSYIEISEHQRIVRKRFGVIVRSATWKHRFVISHPPAWTLVFVGPRIRRWGFWPEGKWCWWRQYNSDLAICEEEVLWTDYKD
jgi:hypothetical protein